MSCSVPAYLDEAERCSWVVLLHEGQILGVGSPMNFSAPMKGRTFSISAAGLQKRSMQQDLMDNPLVVDAVIQGEQVRVVLKDGVQTDGASLLPGGDDVKLREVEPRFEDGFISLLRERVSQTPQSMFFDAGEIPSDQALSAQSGPVIEVEDLNATLRGFLCRRRHYVRCWPWRGFWTVGGQWRRQVHNVSHALRLAACQWGNFESRGDGSASLGCNGSRPHRLHVSKIFSLRHLECSRKHAILRQRLWA